VKNVQIYYLKNLLQLICLLPYEKRRLDVLSQFTKDFTRQLRPTDTERSSARAENKGNRNLSDGTVTRYDEGKYPPKRLHRQRAHVSLNVLRGSSRGFLRGTELLLRASWKNVGQMVDQ